MTLDRISGCLLGLALSDALGAPYEGGFVERLAWKAIGRTRDGRMRWSDDTQMSIDVAESLIACRGVLPDDLARRFARSYRWSRGYGPGAARILKRIRRGENWRVANRAIYRDGSLGNGAAMRAPMIAAFYGQRPSELNDAITRSAVVTHAHPLGIEGAILIATAVSAALADTQNYEVLEQVHERTSLAPFQSRLSIASGWLRDNREIEPREVSKSLGNGIAAAESCVTAIYLAIRFRDQPFLEMQRFIINCRGDVDTIGAMAGAIWGAANGFSKLPETAIESLEADVRLIELAAALHDAVT